ncbi:Alpha/Beta hydrolase protein [Trichoderma compactum]
MLADLTSEKQPLIEKGILPIDSTPPQQSTNNHNMPQKWLLLATISSILFLCGQLAPCESSTARIGQAPPQVRTYPGEIIKWTLCGNLEGSDLECSSITVPMDQFSKENPSNRTFSIPLARLRDSQRATKNITVNPGGPGGSGINWLYRMGKAAQKIAGDNFHILSFDPRGVTNSRPQATCFPDDETRKARSISTLFSLSYDPLADGPKLQPWTSNYVQACSDTMGEYGPYMNTPQTAADMNSILDAVGQEKMIYWGFSYGSLLGQTYATLFPERSERVIIDGIDTEKVLDGFFNECVKASDECPLKAFGHTKEDLKQHVTNFLQSLKEDPIPAYVNTALLAFGLNKNSSMVMEYGKTIHSNDGAAGKSHWPEKKNELLEMLQPWLIPKEHSFAPRRGVETLHPLLILSTTYDPICPLRSAKVARESFVGSRLIEIEGYGHCSSAMPSSCLVPHLHVKCDVDGLYFITPNQKEELLAGRLQSEEGELRAAQYELAGPGELANWL